MMASQGMMPMKKKKKMAKKKKMKVGASYAYSQCTCHMYTLSVDDCDLTYEEIMKKDTEFWEEKELSVLDLYH